MRSAELRTVDVIAKLPDWRDSEHRGDDRPDDIIGATIVNFGAAPQAWDIEGGGLVIDYIPGGATDPKRLVLAFNDSGMWRMRAAGEGGAEK